MIGSRSSTAVLVRLATVALILFSALGSDAPRGAAPPYTVIDLGTFGTVQSAQAFDVNDAGQVVGVPAATAHSSGRTARRPISVRWGAARPLRAFGSTKPARLSAIPR